MCTSVFRTQPFPRGRKSPCAAISRQRGISLIELIMFIVIVSVGVAGILLVMNQVVSQSADPLLRKQALAVAESMLEEIQLQGLSGVACTGTLVVANADRTGASSVCDYDGYHTTGGVLDFATNSVVSGLAGYNIAAAVKNISALPGGAFGGTPIPAGSGVQITVTVTDPSGGAVTATGYRAGR